MTNLNVRKQFAAALATAALAFGASQAVAAPAPFFTYDLDGVAGGTTVVANGLSGSSSETLQAINPTQFFGSGYVQFNALTSNSSAIAGTAYTDTGLYATFTLLDTLVSGSLGANGSTYVINALNINLWYDVSKNNTFIQGGVVNNTGEDVLLSTGSLVGGTGTAGLSNTFGAFLNGKTTVALTGDGDDHFIAPVPFFQFAFSGFNSTGNSWTFNPMTGTLVIGNATGVVDFTPIPEPATLALLGLGLVGLGAKRRQQKAA